MCRAQFHRILVCGGADDKYKVSGIAQRVIYWAAAVQCLFEEMKCFKVTFMTFILIPVLF